MQTPTDQKGWANQNGLTKMDGLTGSSFTSRAAGRNFNQLTERFYLGEDRCCT